MGYHLAGFDVVGVDLARQPHYPFELVRGDALAYLRQHGHEFDAVHASPPCKNNTPLRHTRRFPTLFDPHPELIGPTLEGLQELQVPWVVENVPGAPLPEPVVLCGSMFGLQVRRHRLFASNVQLEQPPCRHEEQSVVLGVYGNGGADSGRAARGGGGGVKVAGPEAAAALGIDWTTHQPGLAQAIPPAYTRSIGLQLLATLT
jgi:DNA (cytosine-5)-methyltransferase 1